jgi:hypothetical protein
MADRKIILTFDPATMKGDFSTEGGLSIDRTFSEYERKHKYRNTLVNGAVEAIGPTGLVTQYPDGCHLIEVEGIYQTKSKPEYAAWSGRPGSENED